MAGGGPVRAGGGVVWRHGGDGVEVLLVHRPRYDDWSFPKGKCEPGESFLDGAVREVGEETGLGVEVGDDLGEVRYVDHRGRPKVVRYWAMTVAGGDATGDGDEVDALAWVGIDEAAARLSYPHDRDLLVRWTTSSP